MGLAILRDAVVLEKLSQIRSVIREWDYSRCRTKKAYADSLAKFLDKRLGYPVQKNTVQDGIRMEVLAAHEVLIDIVPGLSSKAALDRVLKRLKELKAWPGAILFLLTGRVDAKLLARLDDQVNLINNDLEFMTAKDVVVTRL